MTTTPEFRFAMAALFAAIAVVCAVSAIVAARRPGPTERALSRFAERSGLRVSADVQPRLEAFLRTRTVVERWALAVAVLGCGALLLTPLGGIQAFPVLVAVPILFAVMMVLAAVSALRARLFAPAAGAARLARLRVTRTSDYLGRGPRALTWVLASAAGVGAVWVAVALIRGDIAPAPFAVAALTAAVPAGILGAALPRLERRILDTGQPAGSELELAWDDALRASALNAGRQTSAVLFVVALFLAVAAVTASADGDIGWGYTLFVWCQLPLLYVYPTTGARLPRPLYPDGAPGGTAVSA